MYKILENVELPKIKKKYPNRKRMSDEEKIKRQKERSIKYNKSRTKEHIREHNVKSYHRLKNENPEKLQKLRDKVKVYNKKKLEEIAGRPKSDLCEVCNQPGKICFDHCHNENKFRGWICDSCNRALGHAKDNPEILRSLALYLEKSKI